MPVDPAPPLDCLVCLPDHLTQTEGRPIDGPGPLKSLSRKKRAYQRRGGVECRNAQRRVRLRMAPLKRTARALLQALGQKGKTLSVLLVDDEKMRLLHKIWMGSPRTTDVLSFEQSPAAGAVGSPATALGPAAPRAPELLGDVVISVETAARRNPKNVYEEVRCYLVHGILHLSGFHHDNPRSRLAMRRETRRLSGPLRGSQHL